MQFGAAFVCVQAPTGGTFAILRAVAKVVLTFHLLRMQKRLDLEAKV